MPFTLLDRNIATLNPRLNNLPTNANVAERIQNAYFFYKQTGSGAGLAELAALLEDEETGWLPRVLGGRRDYRQNRLYSLIDELKGVKGANRHVEKLHKFRDIRNRIHTVRRLPGQEVELAFRIFLDFTSWYFQNYYKINGLYDEKHYFRELKAGEIIAERFKVLEFLGGDEKTQAYKVLDEESHENHPYVIKRVSILNNHYDYIMGNEMKSRPLFNVHPNIGKFYSWHQVKPVGEVLLLEYIEGQTLRKWIAKQNPGPRTTSDFLYIIGRVIDGLRFIHNNEYIHGKINADSIVITPEEHVKIVSFDNCGPAGQGKYKQFDIKALSLLMEESLPAVALKIPTELRLLVETMKGLQDGSGAYRDWEKVYQTIRYTKTCDVSPCRKIALISCTRRKKPYSCSARELYSESDRFSKALSYAENQSSGYDDVFIVSARYGLVELNQPLEPYDCDLLEFSPEDQLCWGQNIVRLLKWKGIDDSCHVVIHADELYSRNLMQCLVASSIKAEIGCF